MTSLEFRETLEDGWRPCFGDYDTTEKAERAVRVLNEMVQFEKYRVAQS